LLEGAIDEFQSAVIELPVVELEGDAALDGRISGTLLQPSELGRIDCVLGAAVAAPEAAVGALEAARPVNRPRLLQLTLIWSRDKNLHTKGCSTFVYLLFNEATQRDSTAECRLSSRIPMLQHDDFASRKPNCIRDGKFRCEYFGTKILLAF
jgi:hypothetical protein